MEQMSSLESVKVRRREGAGAGCNLSPPPPDGFRWWLGEDEAHGEAEGWLDRRLHVYSLPPSCLSVNLKQLHYSIPDAFFFFSFLNNHEKCSGGQRRGASNCSLANSAEVHNLAPGRTGDVRHNV